MYSDLRVEIRIRLLFKAYWFPSCYKILYRSKVETFQSRETSSGSILTILLNLFVSTMLLYKNQLIHINRLMVYSYSKRGLRQNTVLMVVLDLRLRSEYDCYLKLIGSPCYKILYIEAKQKHSSQGEQVQEYPHDTPELVCFYYASI